MLSTSCWDGKNLDSVNHMDHVSYPANGTFEGGGPCPTSHPVRLPQLMFETIWDTRQFNNPSDWPADGSQPFVWSMDDETGYGNHGDYVFGWKDDSLQRTMDSPCYVNCSTLTTQSMEAQNACTIKSAVDEDVDSCKFSILCSKAVCLISLTITCRASESSWNVKRRWCVDDDQRQW